MLTDTETISFLPMLDELAERKRNKGRRELCKTWKCAVKNKSGVYAMEVFTFPAGSRKDYFLELNLALAFPYVYGEIDYQAKTYGTYTPLDGDNSIRFSVYENHEQLEEYLIRTINQVMNRDKNLEPIDFHNLSKLNKSVVEKAMECMKL